MSNEPVRLTAEMARHELDERDDLVLRGLCSTCDMVTAALRAIADGRMVVVPREPTEEWIAEVTAHAPRFIGDRGPSPAMAVALYEAMVEAAAGKPDGGGRRP